jgi:hypothetical protein
VEDESSEFSPFETGMKMGKSKADKIAESEFGDDWEAKLSLAVASRRGKIMLSTQQIEDTVRAVKLHALNTLLIQEAINGKLAISADEGGYLVFGARAKAVSE